MRNIFASLAVFSTILLGAAFVLGMLITDPRAGSPAALSEVRYHFLTALAGLVVAALCEVLGIDPAAHALAPLGAP